MLKVELELLVDTTVYEIEEHAIARQQAEAQSRSLYTWKAVGREHWPERGASITDALGLLVLPAGLPDVINMPDDRERR